MTPYVLVTGATGFLGRHLLDALAELGDAVRPLILARVGAPPPEGDGVATIVGRLEDAERWEEDARLASCVGIIHCAARVRHSRADAASVFRTNVGGTQAMVRLAARLGCRLVAVSTSGTVGCSRDPDAAPDEDAPFADRVVADWPYYASKIAAERSARALAGALDVDLVVLRPPVLLGPGDTLGRSSAVARRMCARVPVVLDGGYHFADVRDVARAAVRALRHPHPRPVYHLPGWNGTLAGFARLVSESTGRATHPIRVPAAPAHLAARLMHRMGVFVDPVLIEMARHHWNIGSRWSEVDLDYRARDPRVTVREALGGVPRGP
jgi:dihydroflavonol-4-reductase